MNKETVEVTISLFTRGLITSAARQGEIMNVFQARCARKTSHLSSLNKQSQPALGLHRLLYEHIALFLLTHDLALSSEVKKRLLRS